jgi:SAM-dependent methyltransferase
VTGLEPPDDERLVGARAVYDAVATQYDHQFRTELSGKPLDRALLTAFCELTGPGLVADIGCGPGHVTRFLAECCRDAVVGIDLSPAMVGIAAAAAPELNFLCASMLALPVADAALVGAVVFYSIIHLTAAQRQLAFNELARTVAPGGWVLLAFHVDSAGLASGEVNHLTEWFGRAVELDGYFLPARQVADELVEGGFAIVSSTERQPHPGIEYPSGRCYLLARRMG